jgi:tRNA threonylcarbamoyladenosine biosynthesis protein TsaE
VPVALAARGGPPVARFQVNSPAETEARAAALASRLHGGEVLLLHGELGAGKTAFVRGLARGLDCDPTEVASPTFVLLTSYPGRLTLHHADLYRLAGDGDEDELGLDELPGEHGVLAIEWAERLARVPWPRVLCVTLEHAGGERRLLTLEGE